MSKSIDHPSYPFQDMPDPCEHGVSFEGQQCMKCYIKNMVDKVQDCQEIISDMLNSDDEGLFEIYDNLKDILNFVRMCEGIVEENNQYRERLEISPYGDDKIDEQETCIQFLRHEIDSLRKYEENL